MTPNEVISLMDLFRSGSGIVDVPQAEYCVQFLYRDLFSSTDVIGPCFFMSASMTAATIWTCVRETIMGFYRQDFKVVAVVCDGASANVSFLKSMLVEYSSGPFGKSAPCFGRTTLSPLIERFRVPFSIPHPVELGRQLFFLICPSHVLKLLVNSLHASQNGGAKNFEKEREQFGWKTILQLYDRETDRRRGIGTVALVPKLQASHVKRDSWTKLSVFPALVLMRENVLAEISAFGLHEPGARGCLDYLEACNQIFVEGIISHDKTENQSSSTLQSMQKGFEFFLLLVRVA